MLGIPGAACLGIGGTGPGGTVGLGQRVGKGVGWTGIGVLGRTRLGGGVAASSGGCNGVKGAAAASGSEELRKAAAEGDQAKLLKLLEEGVNVNQPDEVGYTALQRASCEGHVDIVKQLIRHKANVDHQDDQHGNTALHEAAWKGYSQTAEHLVRAKANVYVKNKGGFAPLHLACQNGHNQTTRVLLIAGCRPDIKNNYGDTPLHTAGRYGHAGVTRILLSARAGVGETNKNGDTALHIAAAMGRRKLTRILLEAAADQNLKNKQNETARDIARRKEFSQIEEILLNPPPIVTPEERLKIELEQKKRELKENRNKNKRKGKDGKKREKTNDSGASSKDSQSKAKEKKKHKSEHRNRAPRHVPFSPYGCQFYPQSCQMVDAKIESQAKGQLKDGEKYFVDLAGNIKTGPAGVSSRCLCGPLFQQVEHKLEKDKVAIMDHIDIAHEKLDAKINNLEHRTRNHIQKLSDTVKQKLAAEKEECFQRSERNKANREAEAETHATQLQEWVEQRLRNHSALDVQQSQRLRTHKGLLRRKESIREQFLMTRCRSEEFLLEIQNKDFIDDKPRYGDSNILDYPKSVYSIPDQNLNVSELTNFANHKSYTKSPSQHLIRCHSADDLLEKDTYIDTKAKQDHQIKSSDDANKVWTMSSRNIFSYSTSSETSTSNKQQSNTSSSHNCSPLPSRAKLEYNDTVIHDKKDQHSQNYNSLSIQQKLQSNAECKSNKNEDGFLYSQANRCIENKNPIYNSMSDQDVINDAQQVRKPKEWTPFSRYDYRNNNPYMHGDLRCQKNVSTFSKNKTNISYLHPTIKITRSESCEILTETKEESKDQQECHNTQNTKASQESDIDPDTDRKRIQQAVRRLYDGYIVDGKIDLSSKTLSKEHNSENDLLNDSGYSTRLCNTQGPSPVLLDYHRDLEVENLKDGNMNLTVQCRSNSLSSLNSPRLDLNHQEMSNDIVTPYNQTLSRAENIQERVIPQQSLDIISINSDMHPTDSKTYSTEIQLPSGSIDSRMFSADTLRTSSRMSNNFQNYTSDIGMCLNDTIRSSSRISNLSENETPVHEIIVPNTEDSHISVNRMNGVKDIQKLNSIEDHYTNNIEQVSEYYRHDYGLDEKEPSRDEERFPRDEEKLSRDVGSHFVSGLPPPSNFVNTVRSLHLQLKNTNEIIIIGESSLV